MKSLVTILVRGFFASVADESRDRSRRGRLRRRRDVGCERLEDRTLLSVNPAGWSDRALPPPPPVVPPASQAVALVAVNARSSLATARAPAPRMTVSVPDVVERGSAAVFTIALAQPAGLRGASVNYTTRNLRARAGVDYTAVRGTVRFAAGESVKTVNVPTRASSPVQSRAVNFQLVLSAPTNAKIATNAATTRITDPLPPAPASNFSITVTFPDNTLSASQRRIFVLAAQRWSEIITGDLPDVTVDGRVIDDLEIAATAPFIDGVGGILGQATWSGLRNATPGPQLPYLGFMEFDSADVSMMMGNGSFQAVVLHEMAHVLGLSSSLWLQRRFVTGLGTTNPVYTGVNALAEYNRLLRLPSATSVPLENTGGGGTAGSHWRESIFDTEIMTGYAEPAGVPMPISRVTVGALQDLGYTVDYAAADPFVLRADVGGTGPIRAGSQPPANSTGSLLVASPTRATVAWAALTVNVGEAAAKPRPIVWNRRG